MANVKWIKLTTDMFDNRKIKHLRRLPEGNNIVLLWVMLLTLAGRCNAGGMIFLTENIPYTAKMLADELDFEENTVVLGLNVLEQLNMIVADNGFFSIAGWNEYQNVEGMDKIREQNRLRKQKQRAKNALPEAQCHVMSRDCHATDKDKEEDKDREEDRDDIEITAVEPPVPSVPYESIRNLYNALCPSFPKCTALSDARKKAIKARMSAGYTMDDFKTLFTKAENSGFLKGKNDRNWRASFDWLLKDSNMAKVLDGNYDDARGANANGGNYGNSQPAKRYGTYI